MAKAVDVEPDAPWRTLYHSLKTLEKLLVHVPGTAENALLSIHADTDEAGESHGAATTPAAGAAASPSAAAGASSGGGVGGGGDRGLRSRRWAGHPHGEWLMHHVSECLLAGHTWVRLAASRVLGVYLSRRQPDRLYAPHLGLVA